MVTDFWCESAKIGIPRLHSVHRHSTTDGRIATRILALTPLMTLLRLIKNLVDFGRVPLSVAVGLHDELCHAFLVHSYFHSFMHRKIYTTAGTVQDFFFAKPRTH